MNLVDMAKTGVENYKMHLPAKINGLETDIKQAVISMPLLASLRREAAKKHVSARGRIKMLAECLTVTSILVKRSWKTLTMNTTRGSLIRMPTQFFFNCRLCQRQQHNRQSPGAQHLICADASHN